MTHILLARHGETDWNKIGRVQGWTDIPLNAAGEAQADALAERLRDTPISAVYSSDLSRAALTAAPIARTHGLEVRQLPELREKGYGDWEGLTGAELERDYAELWHRYHALRDLSVVVPNGETWPEVRARMARVLERILADHAAPDDTVVVVSHGASARMVILEALQAPLEMLLRLHLDNVSLSRLDFRGGGDSRVIFLNDTGHVAGIQTEGAPA